MLAQTNTPTMAASDTIDSPWLTARGAADYLSCPVSRIRKLTHAGHLPYYREGGRVLYRVDEIEAFILSGGGFTG